MYYRMVKIIPLYKPSTKSVFRNLIAFGVSYANTTYAHSALDLSSFQLHVAVCCSKSGTNTWRCNILPFKAAAGLRSTLLYMCK